ncbi:response regulator [Thermodesulfobacteriota bacterium]
MVRLKKILVTDDEAGIRSLLYDVLSNEGFRVTLAKDGRESLKRMKKDRFDLLITDIHMPRLDGIELLKKMKRAGRKEKVIIMSGRPVNKALLGNGMPPVCTLLNKPFNIDMFLEAVTLALTKPKHRMRKKAH